MTPRDSESVLDRTRVDEIAERLALCVEDVRERPYSHPVGTGWYAEDVGHLLDVARAAERSASIFPGKPGYGEARVELRRVLKSLTSPSEQKEETA